MAYELIYTSVPHGLKLGSSGFCTVAMTNGMPSPLARVMEGMTGYKPLYPMSDSRFANNPPSYFHYSVKVGGSSYDVCGRICSCPIDYTGRTNKIAHFIVPDEMEKQQMEDEILLDTFEDCEFAGVDFGGDDAEEPEEAETPEAEADTAGEAEETTDEKEE